MLPGIAAPPPPAPNGKGETLCLGTPGTGQIAWGQSPKNKETMVRAADLELPTSVSK